LGDKHDPDDHFHHPGVRMNSGPYHLVVWIDHRSAHLFDVAQGQVKEISRIPALDNGRGHVHHKAGSVGAGHAGAELAFLHKVAIAMVPAQEILVVGPAGTKNELKKYLDHKMPLLALKVAGVEPMGRPALEDISAFATLFFRQRDQMSPAFGKEMR
jgi:hypothetical protein